MECKSSYHTFASLCINELIDTLWNVNPGQDNFLSLQAELIDTLWNVNCINIIRCNVSVIRINRYIMECKYEPALDMWYRLVGN